MSKLLYSEFIPDKNNYIISEEKKKLQQKTNIHNGNCKFCNITGLKQQTFITTNDGNKTGKCGLCKNKLWQVE